VKIAILTSARLTARRFLARILNRLVRKHAMRRSTSILALVAALASTSAAADVWEYGEAECNQLWFMRNLVMDRAGYCFGSALGQALYDNGDCIGKEVSLSSAQSRQVQKIQQLEREIGCNVNTGSRRLDLPSMEALRRLRDMPLPDNGGWACIGWMGNETTLYDGYTDGAAAIGQIRRGDRLDFGHINEGDWVPVVVSSGAPGGSTTFGWANFGGAELPCAESAG
jgi:hypothetical protein